MLREETLTEVEHPTFMRLDSLLGVPVHLSLFEHPSLDKVVTGDPTLGWEGDPRLAWYQDREAQRIVLYRLENDGMYRPVLASAQYQIPNEEMANRIVKKLVATDVRRGFDLRTHIDVVNAKADAAKRATERDYNENLADKLGWAMQRDGLV